MTATVFVSDTCVHGDLVAFTVKVAPDVKAAEVKTRFPPLPAPELPDGLAPSYNWYVTPVSESATVTATVEPEQIVVLVGVTPRLVLGGWLIVILTSA